VLREFASAEGDASSNLLHRSQGAREPKARRPAAAIRANEETAYRRLAKQIIPSYSSERTDEFDVHEIPQRRRAARRVASNKKAPADAEAEKTPSPTRSCQGRCPRIRRKDVATTASRWSAPVYVAVFRMCDRDIGKALPLSKIVST
jgi:hypothetical protein